MTSAFLSKRALSYPENPIRGLSSLAFEAESQGIAVLPLNIGAPDTATPIEIRNGGAHFLQTTDAIRYGASIGNATLIQKMFEFYTKRLRIKGIEISMMMITQGASEALDLVLYTIANKGETILTPDPCYSNYISMAYKYNVILKPIATTIDSGFHLIKKNETKTQAFKRIEKLITPQTKAILWSSPGNPTGVIFSSSELRILLSLARKHKLMLIADEVYRLLVLNKANKNKQILRAPSILDVASKKDLEHIIVLDSASKMLSFCGGRVGIVVAAKNIVMQLVKQSSVRGCPSTISQAAVDNINQVKDAYFFESQREFKKRRDALHQGLLSLKHTGLSVFPQPPEGAFYIVADLGNGVNAEDYCKWMLTEYPRLSGKKETVFLTPMQMKTGGFYLQKGKGLSQIRIAYVLQVSMLNRAVAVIGDSLKMYKRLH